MCGIFGFNQVTDVTRSMAPFLAYEMEKRGSHSWGCTDGYPDHVIKHVGPILNTYELPDDWQQVIFHCRHATHGAINCENQHPFTFYKPDGTAVIGIHNGIITNHDELNRKHNRSFEVDSMHPFANIAEGLPTNEIQGYGALAWFETAVGVSAPQLYLSKFNMYDLQVALLKTGETVFCSLRTPIENAVRWAKSDIEKFYQIDGDKLYHVQSDGLYIVKPFPFGYRGYLGTQTTTYSQTTTYARHGGHHASYNSYNGDMEVVLASSTSKKNCIECHTVKETVNNREFYCPKCYKEVKKKMLRVLEVANKLGVTQALQLATGATYVN